MGQMVDTFGGTENLLRRIAVIDLETQLNKSQEGAVMLLGNFDGIHMGHRTLLEAGRRIAHRLNAPLGIMSCEPHPRQFFYPSGIPFRLASAKGKRLNYTRAGFDILFEPKFDATFASRSAFDFAKSVLHDHLKVSAVVVGHDFHSGQKRSGTVDDLRQYGRMFGFEVCVIPPFMVGEHRLSSSLLRGWLSEGAMRKVLAGFAGTWITSLSVDENGLAYFDPSQCLPPEGTYQVEIMDGSGHLISPEILELHKCRRGQLSTTKVSAPGHHFIGGWSQIDAF